MTGAGATWPGGIDPHDANIRIAPTLPPLDEVAEAMDVFVCCVKIAHSRSFEKRDKAPSRHLPYPTTPGAALRESIQPTMSKTKNRPQTA